MFFKTDLSATTKVKATPHIKWDESSEFLVSPLKQFFEWAPTNARAPCLDLPRVVSLTACPLVSGCLCTVGNCLLPGGPREFVICESPSWSYLILAIGIYKALETRDSDLSASTDLLAPRSLSEDRVSLAGVKELQKSPSLMTPVYCYPSPPWIHGHRSHLEQRALRWSCWHISLLEWFFSWFLSPGSTSPLHLLEPRGSLFPGNSKGNL